jgi:hypothetical protein
VRLRASWSARSYVTPPAVKHAEALATIAQAQRAAFGPRQVVTAGRPCKSRGCWPPPRSCCRLSVRLSAIYPGRPIDMGAGPGVAVACSLVKPDDR